MRILMLLSLGVLALPTASSWGVGADVRIVREWWPSGGLQREVQFRDRILNGLYRTW